MLCGETVAVCLQNTVIALVGTSGIEKGDVTDLLLMGDVGVTEKGKAALLLGGCVVKPCKTVFYIKKVTVTGEKLNFTHI